ncbi:MAG: hypothetical protein ACXAB8_16680 [Promethearchaeota archaeon]|jgi:hypothetical protein
MNYRLVKLINPIKSKEGNLTRISSLKVLLRKENNTIYNTMAQFEKEIGSKLNETFKEVKKPVLLREIINLHDSNGIKSVSQIRTMVQKIKNGKDILSPRGLPNIKLVKTKQSEWVLFDGHHSLLSYMIAGRKYLHEVPHFVVENSSGYVNDKEILIFFGLHSIKLHYSNWRNYVINWQAPRDKQLCIRKQNNMGDLIDSIKITQFDE